MNWRRLLGQRDFREELGRALLNLRQLEILPRTADNNTQVVLWMAIRNYAAQRVAFLPNGFVLNTMPVKALDRSVRRLEDQLGDLHLIVSSYLDGDKMEVELGETVNETEVQRDERVMYELLYGYLANLLTQIVNARRVRLDFEAANPPRYQMDPMDLLHGGSCANHVGQPIDIHEGVSSLDLMHGGISKLQ